MKDYVVTQMVEIQIYAEDEEDAKALALLSTTYWDDWNPVFLPMPTVKEGTIVSKRHA